MKRRKENLRIPEIERVKITKKEGWVAKSEGWVAKLYGWEAWPF
jgi:hypothetical protein